MVIKIIRCRKCGMHYVTGAIYVSRCKFCNRSIMSQKAVVIQTVDTFSDAAIICAEMNKLKNEAKGKKYFNGLIKA